MSRFPQNIFPLYAFGIAAQQKRILKGWSIRHLSHRTGLSPTTIQNVEQGINCTADTMGLIAEHLDMVVTIDKNVPPTYDKDE